MEPHRPDHHETAWLEAEGGTVQADWRQGRGCPFCNNSGFRGRIGVFELLEMDAPLARALRRGDSDAVTHAAQHQAGYVNLVRRALGYAETGITSLAEVIRLFGEIDPLRGPG